MDEKYYVITYKVTKAEGITLEKTQVIDMHPVSFVGTRNVMFNEHMVLLFYSEISKEIFNENKDSLNN